MHSINKLLFYCYYYITMARIYINLPVRDLTASTTFYQALGFTKNDQFSNENASAMVWDETLNVMLLTHDFMKWFLPTSRRIADANQTCQVLNALQCESKQAVDAFFDRAITAGATATIATYDHGFMYGRDFQDLDGHIWEVFWMDQTVPQA